MSNFRRFGPPPFSPFFNSRFFDDFEFDRQALRPYWTDKTLFEGQKFGEGIGDVVNTDGAFKVELDVSHFLPEELKVNVVENQVVVEGRHALKNDKYGQIERNFVRKYDLPANTKAEDVTSELSKDGILTIQTVKPQVEETKVRNIPIQAKA